MNLTKEINRISNKIKIYKEDKNHIIARGVTGPERIVSLPKDLDEDLSCIIGMILGDGHLTKNKGRVSFEVSDQWLSDLFTIIVEKTFSVEPSSMTIVDKRQNRRRRYRIDINCAPIYWFLNKVFEIPIGKKSSIIKVPALILNSNNSIKNAFLIGVLLTEGGKRGRGYGLSSASKNFRDGVVNILNQTDIRCYLDEWEHKNYKKSYYGLRFGKKEIPKIMRGCRSGLTGQILQGFSKKFLDESQA